MKSKNVKKNTKKSNLVKFILFTSLIAFGYILGSGNFGFRMPYNNEEQRLTSADIISVKELENVLNEKDFVFINVHTPYEGEIKLTDAFIEYDAMIAGQTMLPEDKNTSIILYCKTGRMSEIALTTLRDLGYRNVRHLEGGMDAWQKAGNKVFDLSILPLKVMPEGGYELPISWGDIGPKLVSSGVIDLERFNQATRLTDEQMEILTKGSDSAIKIDSANSHFVVNMLWALGLAQTSLVYEEGPMGKEHRDRAGNFASTGGWSLARGDAMNHYNRHDFTPLSADAHRRVFDIAENVFRPCCGNATHFPDCNHGMAALAAIHLMVAEGLSDKEIYENVLKLNSFWFGGSYINAATYFARQGVEWDEVDAKEVLGSKFSSGQGSMEIAKAVGPLPYAGSGGGSCGV